MMQNLLQMLRSGTLQRFAAVLVFTVALLGSTAGQAEAAPFYRPIDFSAFHNNRLQDINAALPFGNATLGGVPFSIPVTGNNYYNPWLLDIDAVHSLTFPVNSIGVSEVHTLMNLFWGERFDFETRTVLTSHASIEFFGSAGAYHKLDLYAGGPDASQPGVDLGDFRDVYDTTFPDRWSNKINGTTTTNVFSTFGPGLADSNNPGTYRLDKQKFTLPSTFANQVLTHITLTDKGRSALGPMGLRTGQRVFLAGVTDLQNGPSIVTPKVQFTRLQTFPAVGGFIQVIRVTNVGQVGFQPNLNVAFTSLPGGTTVATANGLTSIFAPGSPYVNTNRTTPLLPGQSVNITVKFNSAGSGASIPGIPHLISGPGAF